MSELSIQDWGAIGEILGAIGVVLTLLYLAGQLRQNTKAMTSSNLQAYSATSLSIADSFADAADVFAKLRDGVELTSQDELKLWYVFVKVFSQMETVFLQHRLGTLEDEVFKARMKGFKAALSTGEKMREAWSVFKEFDLVPAFVEYVDNELLSDI